MGLESKRALVLYFSGTGNTQGAAVLYGKALEVQGFTALVRSIEDYSSGHQDLTKDLHDVSLIAIGGPIYAGNMPDLLVNWVRTQVPKAPSTGCSALVFSTSAGLDNAHGVHSIAAKLGKKGYHVLGKQAYLMPRNFYVDKYPPTPLEDQVAQWETLPGAIQDHVNLAFEALAQALAPVSNRPPMKGLGILGVDLLADLFRMMAKGMGKDYSAKPKCIGCGVCVKRCPMGNISLKDDQAVFDGKCMLCTRCIHICPINAISYKGKYIEQYRPQPLAE